MLQQALRDLDRAYVRFFRGEAGRPHFRRKGRDGFRIQSRPGKGEITVRRLSRHWGEVRVPKLGWVRLRLSRSPLGSIKHLTITRDALGWHVSLCCEQAVPAPAPHVGPPVGIDRGVAATLALSTGELRHCPGLPPGQAKRLRRLARRDGRQETARRRRSNGQRRQSQRQRRTARALRAREARIRKDFLHKTSTAIVKSHGVVVIEELDIGAMTRSAKGTIAKPGKAVRQKAGLNRAILDAGWGELRRQLAYKLDRAGGTLLEVPARHTSQRCGSCNVVDARSRKSQALFVCATCGHVANADVNAAQNILAAGCGRDSAGSPLRRHGPEPRTTRREAARAA